ncbi:hypothetical protein LJK88_38540 [Paenibacillus sp. P26]|nr:hypothetical protein LJK88_38540 [Paenibacillus sp. P26]
MEKLLTKLLFVLSAFAVLLVLGISSSPEPSASLNPNPMKANHEQFERIQDVSMYVQGS